MPTDAHFLAIALEEANLAAQEGEIPVGAVLTCQDTILSRAHNRRENHHSALAHAELLCIEEACRKKGGWRLSDCTLYVTLEPCPMCAGAILNARIGRVVFSLKDARSGCFGSVLQMNHYPFNHKVSLTVGPFADEVRALMRSFFAQRREEERS